MNHRIVLALSFILLALISGRSSSILVHAQPDDQYESNIPSGTAFTYQGRLLDNGVPASGTYDLRFILYDASIGGNQVGATKAVEDVAVSEGYFTVQLDFGMVFDGRQLWIEVGVRPGASPGEYTTLSPRQLLSLAPFAGYSLNAPWSGLAGVPAGFADGVDNDTTYSAGDGLVLSGSQFRVAFAGSGAATSVARSDHHHMGQVWSGTDNALQITGSFDTSDSPAPLVLGNTTGSGLQIDSTAKYGVYIDSAGWDGMRINSAGSTGVSVGPATYYGMSIDSAGWAGVLVASTEGDGFHVNSADGTGLAVVSAGQYGVWAESNNATYEGGHFENSAAGGAGAYALGGSNSAPDLVLGGTSTTNDDGRLYSDMDFAGSDLLLTSNDAVQLNLDEDNDESGDFWILNGADTTVFSVNESRDMTAIGTKSALVTTQDYGKVKLYAVESPQNWFEDFGSSQLVNGSATVTIEPVFAETINLTEDYFVFLTPLGDCALFVAEKTSQNFTVRAMGGQDCNIAFDYRIVAKRLGYESFRLEPAPDMDRIGED